MSPALIHSLRPSLTAGIATVDWDPLDVCLPWDLRFRLAALPPPCLWRAVGRALPPQSSGQRGVSSCQHWPPAAGYNFLGFGFSVFNTKIKVLLRSFYEVLRMLTNKRDYLLIFKGFFIFYLYMSYTIVSYAIVKVIYLSLLQGWVTNEWSQLIEVSLTRSELLSILLTSLYLMCQNKHISIYS